MEPEVLAEVAADEEVDWSADVFPRLLARGAPVFGYSFTGYWEDVGTLESYRQAHLDVLNRQVDVEMDAFETSPAAGAAESAEIDPDGQVAGPALGRADTRAAARAAA